LLIDAMNLTEGAQANRDLVDTVRKLTRLESAVRAALSHAVAVALSQRAHESAGHATTADLLRSECHLSGREANELVVSAVRLREHLHCTFVALQAGTITWSHATTLVRAVDRLGLDTVLDTEHDWIELIGARTGPEALQRVVHTRRLEQVGYPDRRTPDSQVDETVPTSSGKADVGPEASTEATSTRDDSATRSSADADDLSQVDSEDGMIHDELRDLGNSRQPQQPTRGTNIEPDAVAALNRPTTSTLTLSSDNPSTSTEEPVPPPAGCAHPSCATEASLREISFTVHWLDGSRSEILACGLVCDEHAAALASCPVSRIRVGHRTTIRTIGPALVTNAA
jgi:hypothetical protein